ncbi:MAG: aminopeptidase P family protein [Bdellovibrionales bacterium]|nr:aminopeptidase P family protein [Bdellovibrionales bacterium]
MIQALTRVLSRIPTRSRHVPAEADLEGFRRVQGLAYSAAIAVAREIREGWTERRAARLMDQYLRDHGVKAFFHRSLAWYGDRARFHGFRSYGDFFPTERAARPEDVIILDTAPVLDGYAGDIGFTFSMTPQPRLDRAREFLLELRRDLPGMFAGPMTTAEIWKQVDERLRAQGYANCHAKYPFRVLGHRLYRIPFESIPGLLFPFTLHTYSAFLGHGLFSELLSPDHAGRKTGIWAVEPHIGADGENGTEGFGAKFEEILVVKPGGEARWLSDEVPHLKRPGGLF